MMQTALVIGCGITGSVIARYLAEEKGMQVTVWEKRNHIGGNLLIIQMPMELEFISMARTFSIQKRKKYLIMYADSANGNRFS